MKTIRHTVNIPNELDELVRERSRDFRSLSGYFVALCFNDALYLPRRQIAKAFAHGCWQEQNRAVENILTLRQRGWNGVNLQARFDTIIQVEEVAVKCLKKGDWLLDSIQEELAYLRGAELRVNRASTAHKDQLLNTRHRANHLTRSR